MLERLYPQRVGRFRETLNNTKEKVSFLLWSYFQEECGGFEDVGIHHKGGEKTNERMDFHQYTYMYIPCRKELQI